MGGILIAFVIVAMATLIYGNPLTSDYVKMREKLISDERSRTTGGKIVLTSDEQLVSDIFVKEKKRLIENSRLNRTMYMPAISFFLSKTQMEETTLFKLIQRMPKGATLHAHDTSAVSLEWIVKNVTYRDNVFMCVDRDGYIILNVFLTPPSNPGCQWKSVKEERAATSDSDLFDLRLHQNLSLLSRDPLTTYANNAQIWIRFSKYFAQLTNLVNYVPIYKDYIWRMLEEVRADNTQYIELRSSVPILYELDGTKHDAEFGVELFGNVTRDFVKAYPDFSGAKLIMSGIKKQDLNSILEEVKLVMHLCQKYPDIVKGYDLSGNEDVFNPTVYYLEALLYPARKNPPYHLPYFFHAGETNWQGTVVDQNMADALLLNTTRMGHGFALTKHPKLVEIVKQKNIPVEVNPISNQVLCLVSDLRNHPMVQLLADDYPIVVGSDNYGTWEALPLSHDIYVAFMDMCGAEVGLAFVKQLAINSIKYSTMTDTEKFAAMNLWQTKWDTFIQETIKQQTLEN